jgi:hypothetical protein
VHCLSVNHRQVVILTLNTPEEYVIVSSRNRAKSSLF